MPILKGYWRAVKKYLEGRSLSIPDLEDMHGMEDNAGRQSGSRDDAFSSNDPPHIFNILMQNLAHLSV